MCLKPGLFLLYFLFGNCKEVILNKLKMGSPPPPKRNRYGLDGGSMSRWGQVLRFPVLRIPPSVSVNFLLPSRCRTLSYHLSVCTLPCPLHDDNGLNV
uniref:Secreted protein n=1 Tax=Peromyscus maniculatus bairdii TaxID=230844 RepID=A0A8C8UPL3_PERMB